MLAAPIVFAAFLAAIRIAHAVLHLPFYAPTGAELPLIGVCLLAVMGGSCFLAWVLRTVRLRLLIAVIAIPAVLLLFMLGTAIEGQLFCSPTIDTFDYIVEEIEPRAFDEDYEGEVYYDDESGALILNGEAYAPRPAANPEYLSGAARVGGILFEIVDPWSGNGLFMIREAAESAAPGWAMLLYAVKAAAFIIVPLAGRKKEAAEKP